jgi:hypothetical protein
MLKYHEIVAQSSRTLRQSVSQRQEKPGFGKKFPLAVNEFEI